MPEDGTMPDTRIMETCYWCGDYVIEHQADELAHCREQWSNIPICPNCGAKAFPQARLAYKCVCHQAEVIK